MARFFIIAGLLFVAVGLALLFADRLGLPRPGRLPGDLVWRRDGFTFYFPLATSIVLSAVLTLLFWFFGRR